MLLNMFLLIVFAAVVIDLSRGQVNPKLANTEKLSPLEIAQNNLQIQFPDDLAHDVRRQCPNVECYGLDCTFVTDNGCKTCACPIGSPARGCDRLPENLREDLLVNGCPNATDPTKPRYKAKSVIRWYRFVDEDRGINQCRYYMFPYCDDSDFNFWRSPRTHAECSFYCFRRGGEQSVPSVVPL